MIIKRENLDWLQLDITARCNAMCLECSRNHDGLTINSKIGKSDTWDMPIEMIQEVITPDMLKSSLKKIVFNGNFGDPCIHPNFLNISKYILDHAHDNLKVNISTNGAMFNNEYWAELGRMYSKLKRHKIVFGIDGLEDTHHIYRRNTKYEDVMSHAKTFIDAGGKADWQFIIFDHNKHQVDEARKISKQMGFEELYFKGGFDDNGGARNFSKAVEESTTGGKGAATKKNKAVELSVKSRPAFQEAQKIIAETKYRKATNYLDTAKISCQWYDTKGMYIEYDGTVWMCCWMGDMHKNYNDKANKEYEFIANKYGTQFNDLHHHSFDDILKHEYFVEYLDKTFNSTRDDPNTPRSHICAKTCIWNKRFVHV